MEMDLIDLIDLSLDPLTCRVVVITVSSFVCRLPANHVISYVFISFGTSKK